jgi:hypothetical protein
MMLIASCTSERIEEVDHISEQRDSALSTEQVPKIGARNDDTRIIRIEGEQD